MWVGYSTRQTWRKQPLDWGQLVYASRGVLTVDTGEGTWIVPPHQGVWVPPGVRHDDEIGAGAAMRMVYVAASQARRLPRECCAVAISPLLRELLARAMHLRTLDRRNRMQQHLMELIFHEIRALPTTPVGLPMPRDARALRAARHIRDNPSAAHRLIDVARYAAASRRTLERQFRDETGLSFGAWRQRARLLHALRLLADGATVTAAALAVGYESTSAFVAAFRREIGTTPGKYFHRAAPAERAQVAEHKETRRSRR